MAINFLNTVAVDENVLFVDTTNNRVGVGTSTPGSVLDVQGSQGQLFSVTDDLSGDIFAVSDISGVPIMTVNSSGLSTFAGDVTVGAKLMITSSSDYIDVISDDLYIVAADKNILYSGNAEALRLDESQNATFAGTIGSGAITSTGKITSTKASTHVSGNITASNAHLDLYNSWTSNTDQKGSIITFTDNYYNGSSYNKTTRAAIKGGTDTTGNTADGYLEFYTDSGGANSPTLALRLDNDQNATFAGNVTAPTFLGDLNGTINTATTGTTQTAGNNSTLIATTAYADAAAAAVPVGDYLPLTAGSGSPLTGTLYGTSTNFSGNGDYAGSMILGNGASTAEAHLTIGQGRTDSGYSYIDLVGDTTYTDYGLRVIRNNTGSNTTSAIIHRGTGNLEITTVESASVLFKTNSTSAFTLTNTQNAIFDGYVCIGGTNPGANLEIRGTVNTDDCKIYLKENSTYGAYFKYDGDLNRGYIGGITGTTTENAVLSWSRDGSELKLVTSGSTAVTIDSNRDVTFAEDIIINDVLLSNQVNTDIDTGAEVVAQVAHATYTAAFFDFVVKKGTNVRSGTVYACHNGDTTPLVEFTETSTNDLGDTSDVTLSVDISGANMRLLATVTSDDWSVKSLIRAI